MTHSAIVVILYFNNSKQICQLVCFYFQQLKSNVQNDLCFQRKIAQRRSLARQPHRFELRPISPRPVTPPQQNHSTQMRRLEAEDQLIRQSIAERNATLEAARTRIAESDAYLEAVRTRIAESNARHQLVCQQIAESDAIFDAAYKRITERIEAIRTRIAESNATQKEIIRVREAMRPKESKEEESSEEDEEVTPSKRVKRDENA